MKECFTLTDTPRDYQEWFYGQYLYRVDNEILWKGLSGEDEPRPRKRFLFSSPTSTGKSLMQLMALSADSEAILVTPRLEIVAGFLKKIGVSEDEIKKWSQDRLAEEGQRYGIWTPIRLRNTLAKGTLGWRPLRIIFDECHHVTAASWQDILMYLGEPMVFGLSASPFRGTAKQTKEFLDWWEDEINYILDIPDAVERKLILVPQCEVWPLLDDDVFEVVNGEYNIQQASAAVRDICTEVAERCRRFVALEGEGPASWDVPTIFAVPDTDSVLRLVNNLNAIGIPAEAVTQNTSRQERARIFADCEAKRTAIVQIDVISEGVDLRINRVIDLRSTRSPVKWLQQIGRIRPGLLSHYIVCNRNLEHHGYLYQGCIPSSKIAEAQKAFGKPTVRPIVRATGIETLGRFQPTQLAFADGCTGTMYHFVQADAFQKSEYCIIIHPGHPDPLYAARQHKKQQDGRIAAWSDWTRVEAIPNLIGFGAAPAKTLSEKQRGWWTKSAGYNGLNGLAPVNTRNFQALPVLSQCGYPKEWRAKRPS